LDVGCTPILLHHFKITRQDPLAEPQLEDMAYSGVQEFARQWILLGRRAPFDPEDPEGRHKLWLSAGGSAGPSLLRAVDLCEGKMGKDFKGKTWTVEVMSPRDARVAESDEKTCEKQRRQAAQDKADDAKVLNALDKQDPNCEGMVFSHLSAFAKLS